MKLSLVIPCYNEADNLPLLFERCRAVCADRDIEVVLVDNGSTDTTPAVLNSLLAGQAQVRSVRVEQNQGYGHGIVSGLKAAEGDILAWTHADMQTDPMDAVEGMEFFSSAADPKTVFVKGKRYGRPLADVVFTVGMSCFETLLLGYRFWDINAQPTMFHRSFFEGWADPPSDFSLDLFAYYHAKRLGLHVKRFKVRFGERAHGLSHWNISFSSKVKFIKRTIDFSLKLRRALVGKEGAATV